ncbi:MAG: DUF4439 domain-containing protein [Actinobacteria bacterium]|uniref:Unannotated protein n=1 Tax=freshwater metagenome TaxID=449393 RepID=A0A6J7REF9_9ZZZZ|nr:DUF4439 domain-containing protein [Actinomycetota bacterium]
MTVPDLGSPLSPSDALQAVLAGEYACGYAYGLIGAQLEGDPREKARRYLAEHSASRNDLRRLLLARGVNPEAAAAAYNPPFSITTPASGLRLAALIEDRLALVWSDLVASARSAGDAELTTLAVAGVAASAVRSSSWSRKARAFPGLLTAD